MKQGRADLLCATTELVDEHTFHFATLILP